MSEKLNKIKELLDAKAVLADVILTDSERHEKYTEHLYNLMGEDTIPASQPILADSVESLQPECCICFEQYVIDFVPNRCKHIVLTFELIDGSRYC